MGIFQSGVMPMWEDPVNKDCVELRAKIPSSLTKPALNTMWEEIVVDLITKRIPFSELVAGIRVCDKSRGGDAFNRFEIWTKIPQDTDEKLKAKEELIKMKAHIENLFVNHGHMVEVQIATRK